MRIASSSVVARPLTKSASSAGSTAPESEYSFPQNQDWFDAGSLMSQRGIATDGHQLMQENLASCLAHRRQGQVMPSGRWETKIQRELDQPYSDQQVFRHIDTLQSSLLENLSQLPNYPSQVYLTGSFSKGRMGANSDLNGYAVVDSKDFDASFDLFGKRFQDQGQAGANLFPMTESSPGANKGMLMVEGTSLLVSSAKLNEPGYLKNLYQEVLANKPDHRQEVKPSFDGLTGKMWRSKFDRNTFHFKAMRWAVQLGGALSRVPWLGALAEGAAANVITQNHRVA